MVFSSEGGSGRSKHWVPVILGGPGQGGRASRQVVGEREPRWGARGWGEGHPCRPPLAAVTFPMLIRVCSCWRPPPPRLASGPQGGDKWPPSPQIPGRTGAFSWSPGCSLCTTPPRCSPEHNTGHWLATLTTLWSCRGPWARLVGLSSFLALETTHPPLGGAQERSQVGGVYRPISIFWFVHPGTMVPSGGLGYLMRAKSINC